VGKRRVAGRLVDRRRAARHVPYEGWFFDRMVWLYDDFGETVDVEAPG